MQYLGVSAADVDGDQKLMIARLCFETACVLWPVFFIKIVTTTTIIMIKT